MPPISDYSDLDIALMRWAFEENLSELIWYHNTVRGMVKREYNGPDASSDKHLKERLRRCDYLNSASCLLVMFGYLEEMLFGLWRLAAPQVVVNRKLGALERYKPVLRHLNLDFGSASWWCRLIDAAVVRNCLMHAHGDVSRMDKPEQVQACIARNKRTLLLEGGRLHVTPAFLGSFVKAVRQLRDGVLGA